MKLENIENKISEVLSACFSDVTAIRGWDILSQPSYDKMKTDVVAEVRLENSSLRLLIEVKAIGQPRQTREAVNHLLVISSQELQSYPVFIAPYISPASAQICKENGVGYADLAGNCRIAFDGIYILREGRPNPFISKRVLRSLYQPASSRVLRALFAYPEKAWKTVDLQKEAGVSVGMVSIVRRTLLDREWIEKESDGVRLKNPKALLDDWSNQYSFRKNAVNNFYSLMRVPEIEETLASVCKKEGIEYALTAFSAAAKWAPSVRSNRIFAYVREDINKIVALLQLKPVTSGANVTLLLPYDRGVFYGAEERTGMRVVSPIQTYLDLIGFRGRGEEAAEYLLKKVIQKQW